MRNPVVEFSQISRCLICHDAPCTKVCPRVDPARILRAIRFENDLGAAMFPTICACVPIMVIPLLSHQKFGPVSFFRDLRISEFTGFNHK